MKQEVNWALVVGSGILVGLLILAVLTGLFLLLSRPAPAEPLERPAGMLAWQAEGRSRDLAEPLWGKAASERPFDVAG